MTQYHLNCKKKKKIEYRMEEFELILDTQFNKINEYCKLKYKLKLY